MVGNKPSLREYDITELTAFGNTYRFKVRAHNYAGFTDSQNYLNVVLADEPDKPTVAPSSDASVTNESRIKVDFGPQLASENGGSPILTYELQIDNGIGGNFTTLIGGEGMQPSLETTFTVYENIISGGIYRFRFRSKNANGWSPWSEETHIKAATSPQRPDAPTLISATDSSI